MRTLTYQIRPAHRGDLERITQIYNWAVQNSVATFDLDNRTNEQALQWYIIHQDSYYPLYAAEKDGEVVGWASISPFHPRPAYKKSGEFSIYIEPEFQGLGIGKDLLETLCQEAQRLGYHTLLGLITATNAASLAVSAKQGFKETGLYREVGSKFGQLLDVVVVQRIF